MGIDPFSIIMGIGSLVSAYGSTIVAGEHAARQSEQRAEIGIVQAKQTDANYRQELNATINNIRAIRASTGAGFMSPTGAAIENYNRDISDRDRRREVGGRRIQASVDRSDADFRRSAAQTAFFGKAIGTIPTFFGQ